jgi:hypothetical protein
MAVTIDIPGVGNVEAKNAASEATLREILKAMQGVERNTKKMAGQPGGGETGGGGVDPIAPVVMASKTLAGKMKEIGGGFARLGESIISTVNDFAKVGDSVENAAAVFQSIPLLGTLFGAVASASAKVNDALLAASKSGAGFGDSITQFAGAASAAGMTLDNFGQLIKQNGEGMLGFGGTTEEGAKRFSQVSKALRTTSGDLYALGFSTADINQGLASYGQLMRTQGLQGKQSNDQMVNGAKTYLKELDAMAKITGEERSAKESQMKQLATDAQFQASMAGKSAEARQSFLTTVGKIPGPLQGFVKDFLATGTLTTEETQRIGAMMGGDVMRELQGLRSKLQSGAVLSAEEQDRLGIIMKRAAEQQLKNAGTSLAGATDMHGAVVAVGSALTIQEGAVKKSAEEQRKAALEGSGFNKKMQEIQQRLAEFSNGFLIALSNSGVLDFMMKTFSFLANLVQTFVVPAFNILASVISTVGGFVIDVLVPPFEMLAAFIEDNVTPILVGLGTALGLYAVYTIAANAAKIAEIGVTVAKTVAMLALIGPLAIVALGLAALASPLGLIAVVAAGVAYLFKKLYDNGWSFGTAIEAIKDNLRRFELFFVDGMLSMLEKIAGWFGKGDAIKAARARIADERKELDDKEAARDGKRKVIADERAAEKEKNANARERNKLDKKELADKKAIADEKNKLDHNSGPEALLKQFGIKENSKFAIDGKKVDVNKEKEAAEAELKEAKTTAEKKAAINKIEAAEKKLADLDKLSRGEAVPKDKSRESLPKAEAAKKELEAKGEEKTAAEKKAAEERAKAEEKAKEENKKEGRGAAPTQESAESLLASLNTKMTELIKINKGTQAVSEQQLSVQKGMTSDLFAA